MEKYLVINSDEEIEYVLTVDTVQNNMVISLYASNSIIWTESTRGEFRNSLTDDGNQVIFKEMKRKLDYSALVELRILVNFNTYMDKHLHDPYRIVEDKTLIKIK